MKQISHSQTKFTYPKFNTKSLQSLQSHPSGSHLLILFLKSSRLFKFLICSGTICQTFEPKNLIEFRPYLLLFTEFLKKSDWVCKLYFINLAGKMLLIISFKRFYSISRLQVFLWCLMKKWSFWSNSWNELMLPLMQFIVSARISDWFFYSILYQEISKLADSSQTGLQWRILLGLSFVLELYNLRTLLKQTISHQLFYINLKRARQRITLYLYVPPIAFVY